MCSQMVNILGKYAELGRQDFRQERYLSFESIEWLIRSCLNFFLHVVSINTDGSRFLADLGYSIWRSRGTKIVLHSKAMNSLEEARFLLTAGLISASAGQPNNVADDQGDSGSPQSYRPADSSLKECEGPVSSITCRIHPQCFKIVL